MDVPPVMGPRPSETGHWEPPVWSVPGRMVNVFGVPGQVFEDVLRSRPDPGNWLWPALLGLLVGFVGGWMLWAHPAVRQGLVERQRATLERRVESGALAREEADQRLRRMEEIMASAPVRGMAAGAAGVGSGLRFLFWGALLWGVGRWAFGVGVPWGRCCELAGLASLVGVMGQVLELMLLVPVEAPRPEITDPAQVVPVAASRGSWVLGLVQGLFGFWQVAVMGVALSKLTGVQWIRALWVLLGLWLVWVFLLLLAGWVR